jgi:hypothetical protein
LDHNLQGAEECFGRSLQINPTNTFALLSVGCMKASVEETLYEAESFLTSVVVEVERKSCISWAILGAYYSFAGKESESQQAFTMAVQLRKSQTISSQPLPSGAISSEDRKKVGSNMQSSAFHSTANSQYQSSSSPQLSSNSKFVTGGVQPSYSLGFGPAKTSVSDSGVVKREVRGIGIGFVVNSDSIIINNNFFFFFLKDPPTFERYSIPLLANGFKRETIGHESFCLEVALFLIERCGCLDLAEWLIRMVIYFFCVFVIF